MHTSSNFIFGTAFEVVTIRFILWVRELRLESLSVVLEL